MTKRQFLVILYLLVGIIPLTAQTFTEQKKSYPVSADGNKYVVSGFTPFSDMQDENIYANALLWIVKNVCPQLREGIAEVNVPAKNFSCDLILASQADSSQKNTYYCKALFQVKDGKTGLLSFQYTDRVISSDNEKNHSYGEATTGQESISQRNHG